jgi:hypothetical protein
MGGLSKQGGDPIYDKSPLSSLGSCRDQPSKNIIFCRDPDLPDIEIGCSLVLVGPVFSVVLGL